jgi:hypothetical protein
MYRLKNSSELKASEDNACLLAYCDNPITKTYEVDKDFSVNVCDKHFKLLTMSRYTS